MNTMDAASWMAGIPEAAASWDAAVGRNGIFVPPLQQLQRLHRSAKETLQLEAQSHRTLSTIDEGAAPEAAAPQPSCVSPAASSPQSINSSSTRHGRESDAALDWLSSRVAEAMALDINAAAPAAAAPDQATVLMPIRATRQRPIRATGAEPIQVADEGDPVRRDGHMRRSRSFEIGRALFARGTTHALSLRRTQSLERKLLREAERRDEREQQTPNKGWAFPRLLPLRSLLSRHWTPSARSPHEGDSWSGRESCAGGHAHGGNDVSTDPRSRAAGVTTRSRCYLDVQFLRQIPIECSAPGRRRPSPSAVASSRARRTGSARLSSHCRQVESSNAYAKRRASRVTVKNNNSGHPQVGASRQLLPRLSSCNAFDTLKCPPWPCPHAHASMW